MNAQMHHLDPAIEAWTARIAELSTTLPDLANDDPRLRRAAERQLSDALAREFTSPPPPHVRITTELVDTRLGPLRIRRYLPRDIALPAPSEVFLHGGGFISGSIDELINDGLLAGRAAAADIQIIALDYRLAPEHPYPAAVDDVTALLDALCEESARFDVDVERLGIGGASAGAGIAASATLHLRDGGGPALIHQSLEVPAVTLVAFGASSVDYAHGFGLDGYYASTGSYVGAHGRDAEYAQALFASNLEGLPPAHVHVAEYDPLRDAGIAYAERLREAGVPALVDVGAGHVHGSPGLTATFAAARAWQRRSAAAARRAYHRPLDHRE